MILLACALIASILCVIALVKGEPPLSTCGTLILALSFVVTHWVGK